ncbi:MAG: thiamine phosphate synthase, partial [Mariprofundus sp.]
LVREKEMDSARLLAFSARLREVTGTAGARLIIHSQADIALAVDADGVHLSSREIHSISDVRRWLADPAKTVSVSCHNAEELQQASKYGADYAMLSPLFPTKSHPGAAHLGVEKFHKLVSSVDFPVIALGGITTENCQSMSGTPLAVISALLAAEHPQTVALNMLSAARGNA